ncbi:hypothetical protein [Streptomyces sp. NPDC002738]
MTESMARPGQPVTVLRDGRLRAAGLRWGDVVANDWGFEQQGQHYIQRSFVLLDDGIQINQPVLFRPEQQGWWYRDLVAVVQDSGLLRVDDLWIDVIVGPPDHPYRLLDLDEYATAMAHGQLSPAEAADGLIRTQRFLDRRLNRRHEVERSWPDFPPAEVKAMLSVDLPRDWTLMES